jgi:phytoene synthase
VGSLLPPALREACRAWIRHHSKSFYLSSLLLPARVREASWALYAFCRRADDAVDDVEAGAGALLGVESLRRRLDDVYGPRRETHEVDRAFALVVDAVSMPRALPEALLAGMEMDAAGTARYATWDDLLLYCFRVASTVGLMMTRVMGVAREVGWLRAADLGVAMQLTNIARDVGEDARRGRVYLPLSLCREVGLDPDALVAGARSPSPSVIAPAREAVRRLLEVADAHYRSADLGVPLLPRGCRVAIRASRLIYSRIGDAIAEHGYDSISRRAYVSTAKKLALAVRATAALASRPRTDVDAIAGPADALLATLVAGCGLPTPRTIAALPVPA